MNIWFAVFLSFLVGFLVEWVVDWRFWRRNKDDNGAADKLNVAESNIRDLEVKLKDALNREPEKIIETVIKEVKVLVHEDRLQDVKGVGNVFAKRLNGANIFTFEELAATSSERLTEIIDPKEWQALETEAWIEHAKQLVQKKADQAQ